MLIQSASKSSQERFVDTGDFAVIARCWKDSRGFEMPLGLFVRVMQVEPGTPPKRHCVIAWYDPERKAIGRVKVPEYILRVVEMKPGKCEKHIDEAHQKLLALKN